LPGDQSMSISRFRKSLYLSIVLSVAAPAQAAVTYLGSEGVYERIFNANPEQRCMNCHHSSLATGAPRSFAPDSVNFDTYAWATSGTNETRAVVRLTSGTMPPTGAGDADLTNNLCGSVNCSTLISGWETSGFPNTATPEVVTGVEGTLSQTTAVLNGTFQENGLNTTAWFMYWRSALAEPGSCPADTANSGCTTATTASGEGGNDIDQSLQHTATGLYCSTAYTYRAQANNATYGTVSGGSGTFTTSACTSPAITDTSNVAYGASTSVNMDEDGTPTAFSFTVRSTADADGFGTLTWDFTTTPANGTVTYGGSATASTGPGLNRTVTYTPNANFNGSNSFTIRVRDNTNTATLSDTLFVTVNVASINDAPVIAEGASTGVTMDEDGSPLAFSLTLNASDVESAGSSLTWSIFDQANNGTATATGTGSSKAILYTPNTHYNGSDTFDVRVTDANGGTDTITVNVTINAVADSPIIAEGATLIRPAIAEDNSDNFTLNASDGDTGTTLTWSLLSDATNGSVTGAIGTGTSKSITYTPDLDYTGADSFVIRVSDGTLTDDITVNMTVNAVDDPPVITEGAGPVPVSMSEDSSPTAFSLTLNATDSDGDTLTWAIHTQATNGTATASGTGASKAIGYTPTAHYNGSDSFVVRVYDGAVGLSDSDEITVNVTITAQADTPIIRIGATSTASTPVTMSEDGSPTAFSLANLNAFDPDAGAVLTWTIAGTAVNGTADAFSGVTTTSTQNKTVGYTPASNFNGLDSFIVRATDNTGLSDDITVNLTINAVNDAPVITEGATTPVTMSEDASPTPFSLTLNATDVDTAGSSLTWSISSSASNGTASTSGTGLSKAISYTPDADFNGADSFVVRINDGSLSDTITVNVTVNAVNDAPVAVDDSGFDFNVQPNSADNPLNVLANDGDVDGDSIFLETVDPPANGGTAVIGGNCAADRICYTPPPGFSGLNTISYRIRDTSMALSNFVTVTIGDTDTDGDSLADFQDNCDNTPNFDQANNDLDSEGDACDADDDNDGMTDDFENQFSAECDLDPFDPLDAAGDCDGDGLSNVDEEAAGGDPSVDDVDPVFSGVEDKTVNATGYLTAINLGNIRATDGADGAVIVNVDSVTGATDQANALAGLFRPGTTVITRSAEDSLDNSTVSVQTIEVRPLANLIPDQIAVEGGAATITVMLNGLPLEFDPVTLDFTVSGTSSGLDHDAPGSGTITITYPDVSASTVVNFNDDGPGDNNETFIVTLSNPNNAVLGTGRSHTVTIAEGNVAPAVTLTVQQGGNTGTLVNDGSGTVVVTANVNDLNAGDTASFNWSGTPNPDPGTGTSSSTTFEFDAAVAALGFHSVSVEVTDGAGATATAEVFLSLIAAADVPVFVPGSDTDDDGIDDDNAMEGYADLDGDGIPNYLDAYEDVEQANLIQNQAGDLDSGGRLENIRLIETEPGFSIRKGPVAVYSNASGIMVSEDSIMDYADDSGVPRSSADDSMVNIGGIYDFEIYGMLPGATAQVVVPLPARILAGSSYRKFSLENGWQDFNVGGANAIASTRSTRGVCPAPGHSSYRDGLNTYDDCVELTLVDGGANDADGIANGVIRDPGGVAVVDVSPGPEPEDTADGSGGGVLHPFWLLLLGLWGGFRVRKSRLEK
jgi:hypothetical protein